MGSSPVRGNQGRRRDTEVMGLARRAKGISDDVKDLNIQSSQKAVDDLLAKAEGLKDDAVSVKAIQGVKVSPAACQRVELMMNRPMLAD